MGVILLFLVTGEKMHPVVHGSIWKRLEVEILQDISKVLKGEVVSGVDSRNVIC